MPVYNKMPKNIKLYKWEKWAAIDDGTYYINRYTDSRDNSGIFVDTVIRGALEYEGKQDNDKYQCYYANASQDESAVKYKYTENEDAFYGYVYSTNPLAYPPDGAGEDGLWYTFIQDENEPLYFWKEYEAQSACVIHHTNYFSPPTGYPYFMETKLGGLDNYGGGDNTIAWNKDDETDSVDSITDAYYIIQKAAYNIKPSFPQTRTVSITTCDTRLYEPIQEIPIVKNGKPEYSYTFSNVQPYMRTAAQDSLETDEESVKNGTYVSLPFYNPTYYYCSLENSEEWKNKEDKFLYSAQIDQTKFNYVYSTYQFEHNRDGSWTSVVSNPDTEDPRHYKLYIPV